MKLIHRAGARMRPRPWRGIRVQVTLAEVMQDLVGVHHAGRSGEMPEARG